MGGNANTDGRGSISRSKIAELEECLFIFPFSPRRGNKQTNEKDTHTLLGLLGILLGLLFPTLGGVTPPFAVASLLGRLNVAVPFPDSFAELGVRRSGFEVMCRKSWATCELPDVGHMAMLDAPDRLSELIIQCS